MGHMLKKINKIGKKDNFGIKIKYITLLKNKSLIFFKDQFDRKKSKNMQFFSYLKNQSILAISQKKMFLKKIINVGVKLSKTSRLKNIYQH